ARLCYHRWPGAKSRARSARTGVTLGMAASKLPYFLLGIGVGAAMGILYAPQTGEEMRSGIRRRAGDGREYVKRRGGELRHKAGTVIDSGRDAVSSQRDQL